MTKHWIGTTLRHTMSFYDTDGTTLIDPTNLKLRMRKPYPGAPELVYVYGVDAEIVRDSLGVYHVDVTYQLPGRHHRRWEATGNITVIAEEWTKIEGSAFDYLYATSANGLTIGSPQLQSPTLTEN